MKNLAPDIARQRLMIEGFYSRDVDEAVIAEYFSTITRSLNLTMYREPIILSPGGRGKAVNQGYDAFAPLIDSGISVYVWSGPAFLSLIIYTCKDFDEQVAIDVTKNFWKITSPDSFSF